MEPWMRLFSPTIRFPDQLKLPMCGDLSWDYRPVTEGAPLLGFGTSTTVQERQVFTEVTIGRQLGRITDVVVMLAAMTEKKHPNELEKLVEHDDKRTFGQAIDLLRNMHAEIHDIKVRTQEDARKEIKDNLRMLRKLVDKQQFKELVAELERDHS